MRNTSRAAFEKLGKVLFFAVFSGPFAACEVHLDTAPPATPATSQIAPPPAPEPAPPAVASAPAKPTKVIPLHVRGSGAATSATPDPAATAAPASPLACFDAAPVAIGNCAAMAAPDPGCVSTTTGRQRCSAYQADFNPKVAASAVACMTMLTGTQQCDPTQADRCATIALTQACADGSVAQLCGIAASVCKATAADCSTLLSGLNSQGKQQVARCVAQGCSAGLVGCIQSLR